MKKTYIRPTIEVLACEIVCEGQVASPTKTNSKTGDETKDVNVGDDSGDDDDDEPAAARPGFIIWDDGDEEEEDNW